MFDLGEAVHVEVSPIAVEGVAPRAERQGLAEISDRSPIGAGRFVGPQRHLVGPPAVYPALASPLR
jgi:hypothetical protein